MGVTREAVTGRSDANTNLQAFSQTMETHSPETVTMATAVNVPCVFRILVDLKSVLSNCLTVRKDFSALFHEGIFKTHISNTDLNKSPVSEMAEE